MSDEIPKKDPDGRTHYPTKAEWMPEAQAARDEMIDKLMGPLDTAYEAVGLTCLAMAAKRAEQVAAAQVRHIKVSGPVDPLDLPPGYRLIVQAAEGGESLLEYTGPDYTTQLRAVEAVEKNRGWSGADRVSVASTGTVIHVHTHVAEPLPLPAGFRGAGAAAKEEE